MTAQKVKLPLKLGVENSNPTTNYHRTNIGMTILWCALWDYTF